MVGPLTSVMPPNVGEMVSDTNARLTASDVTYPSVPVTATVCDPSESPVNVKAPEVLEPARLPSSEKAYDTSSITSLTLTVTLPRT